MTTGAISKILLNREFNVPFIYFDLKTLVLSLQRLFIKLEVIGQCQTASDFLKIDLRAVKTFFGLINTTIGFVEINHQENRRR